jgi:hypothetical protein
MPFTDPLVAIITIALTVDLLAQLVALLPYQALPDQVVLLVLLVVLLLLGVVAL